MPADARSVYPNGTYAVVGGNDLQDRTAKGWRLVQILATAQQIQFVVLQEKDATHEELRKQLDAEERRRREEQDKVWSATRHIKQLERELEAQAKRVEELEKVDLDHQAQHSRDELAERQLRDMLSCYERDFARVRKFVGEKTWAEALATKEDA